MIGKPGCGFNFANLQSYIFDDIKEPLSYYPDREADKPFRRAISMARFGHDFFALKEPAIEVAWIERGNPVIQLPGSGEVQKALESIPFKVVVEQFMTDTAAIADIILPAKGIFEQADVVGSYWNPYAQYKPKVTDLPGEVLPESEIYRLLAQRLELPAGKEKGIPAPEEYDSWLAERISQTSCFVHEELFQKPVIPEQNEHPAYANKKFDTPSGKIELWSDLAVKQWGVSPLPVYEPPEDLGESHLPLR
ncbi:hypothetical protein EG830_09310, partial [bacterium]|nr:hypothetical protein [bacterium]